MDRGRPVQIVKAYENHTFELDHKALAQIVCCDKVKDLPISVISIAGSLRKGKSFILDFFLRYLQADGEDSTNWLGSEEQLLTGFIWKHGIDLETNGIFAWSEIFIVETKKQKIGVLLLDTQGLFGKGSIVQDAAYIFSLTMLISSMQVYNILQIIDEEDLQYLMVFIEYGKLALLEASGGGNGSSKPFQKIMFLVRDWPLLDGRRYGMDGGKDYLDNQLEGTDASEELTQERQSLGTDIRNCYTDISCFLMPHPGETVTTDPTFKGKLKEIDPDFTEQLKSLVPLILSPENLVVKQIDGKEITAKELAYYFELYTTLFNGDKLPKPRSVLEATAEANNLSAIGDAIELYSKVMKDAISGSGKPFLRRDELLHEHLRVKTIALDHFAEKIKFGKDYVSIRYKKKRLDKDIEHLYSLIQKNNDNKELSISHLRKTFKVLEILLKFSVLMLFVSWFLGFLQHNPAF